MKPSQFIGIFVMLIIILAALTLVFGSWVTVEAGHRGVLMRMGAVTGTILPEGMSFKMPWMDTVVEVDVRVQKEQVKTDAASKDLQTVKAEVAANLRVDPTKVANLYQQVGVQYLDRIVAPAMQESIKAVTAQYTAEQLITHRDQVRDAIKALLAQKLQQFGIDVDALNIVNFDFSPSFNASIEAKVTAEQNALAAKNKLAQIEYEAQQAAALARGKAEAIQIESKALFDNPQILQLRALEKWNGVLPQVMGAGALPFIEIGKPVTTGK